MAYARHAVTRPRQCIFIGTTNEEKYLRDQTGNRRFWPVKTETIDLEALRRDRDQLWAEAASLEAEGADIHLPRELWAEAAAEQSERLETDPWLDILIRAEGEVEGETERISTEQLFTSYLDLSKERMNQGHSKRLAMCMKALGWKPAKFRQDGLTKRGYERPYSGPPRPPRHPKPALC
jgi:predicted P-loop ATPase